MAYLSLWRSPYGLVWGVSHAFRWHTDKFSTGATRGAGVAFGAPLSLQTAVSPAANESGSQRVSKHWQMATLPTVTSSNINGFVLETCLLSISASVYRISVL